MVAAYSARFPNIVVQIRFTSSASLGNEPRMPHHRPALRATSATPWPGPRHMPMSHAVHHGSGMQVAMYLFASLAVTVSILMTLIPVRQETGITTMIAFRYMPFFLMSLAATTMVLSGSARKSIMTPPVWNGLALMAYILVGSAIFVFIQGNPVNSSFIGKALTMIALPVGAVIGFHPHLRKRFALMAARIAVVVGVIGLVMRYLHTMGVIFVDEVQILHEEFVFLAAGLAFLAIRKRSAILTVILTVLIIMLGFLTGKATTTLMGLMLFSIQFGGGLVRFITGVTQGHSSKKRGNLLALLSPIILLFALAGLFVLGLTIYERMNRHKYDVRSIAYEARWEQFLDNPIFGEFFVMSNNLSDIMGFGITTPSHNDILDILAAGGIVALVMFIACLLPALLNKTSLAMLTDRAGAAAPALYFWLVLVFYALGGTGNPLLVMPSFSTLVWFSAGFVLGHARHSTLAEVAQGLSEPVPRRLVANR